MSDLPAPKVSVTVVTYNHAEWLRECLDSIVAQRTDFSFEVLVGDDCSTDGITREILQDFAERHPSIVVPVLRDVNVGITENWLDLIRRTRGTYVAHIDGDDRMLPGKLQKQSEFLDRHSDCSMVGHDLRVFDGQTGAVMARQFTRLNVPEIADIEFLVLNRCYFGHSSKMFRRNAMVSWGRDRPTIDFFLHVEQASRGRIGYINEVLGEYRRVQGSATDRKSAFYQHLVRAYDDAFNRAVELGVDSSVVARGRLSFNYSMALGALAIEEYDEFRKFVDLGADDVEYASWKHRVLHGLRFFPGVALTLLRLNAASHKRFGRGLLG